MEYKATKLSENVIINKFQVITDSVVALVPWHAYTHTSKQWLTYYKMASNARNASQRIQVFDSTAIDFKAS